jgi:hypothetical protein
MKLFKPWFAAVLALALSASSAGAGEAKSAAANVAAVAHKPSAAVPARLDVSQHTRAPAAPRHSERRTQKHDPQLDYPQLG